MKRVLVLAMLSCMCVLFSGCQNSREDDEGYSYSMNASISYGSENDGTTTKITYDVIINGSEEEIALINAYDFIVNERYKDLVSTHNVYGDKDTVEQKDSMRVKGSFLVNTEGITKEELDEDGILLGIKLFDDKFNEITTLEFKRWDGE